MKHKDVWDFLPEEQRKNLAECHRIVLKVKEGPLVQYPKLLLAAMLVGGFGICVVIMALIFAVSK